MTPTRLREILDALHWSQRDLAGLLSCNERLVRRWAAGQADVPSPLAAWIETRLADHRRNLPPTQWRTREPVSEPAGSYSFGEDPDDFAAVNAGR